MAASPVASHGRATAAMIPVAAAQAAALHSAFLQHPSVVVPGLEQHVVAALVVSLAKASVEAVAPCLRLKVALAAGSRRSLEAAAAWVACDELVQRGGPSVYDEIPVQPRSAAHPALDELETEVGKPALVVVAASAAGLTLRIREVDPA
mmetsp:Transcript_54200/g.100151  ORF Transcript_54200/g.100151 Transcript_54200/m.100151 type:complete len:149 (+) Transcript_54200:170-616(+)